MHAAIVHINLCFSYIHNTMADPAWGIWGKCPPPQPCGGASHASD